MPHNRFFSDRHFHINDKILLEKEETHHMSVMRCKENDLIELVNGKNQLATAKIIKMKKPNAELLIKNVHNEQQHFTLILVQANLRFSKLEWIFEKGVELGVTHFWIFPSKFSEKKNLTENQKKRALTLFISALKQCGRLDLPKLEEFSSEKDLPDFSGEKYLGSLEKKAPKLIYESPKQKEQLIVIGPEKGFTEEEMSFFLNQYGCIKIKLSENILRSETAAICAVSILSQLR